MDEELEALLNWNPPRLTIAPDGSTAKKTHSTPGFYARHLHDQLILKEVRSMQSLVQDIANVVDCTLVSIRNRNIDLPPKGDDYFITAKGRETRGQKARKAMRNKGDVACFYRDMTANICLPVASTLALHPHFSEWTTVLCYSDVADSRGEAIADGVLSLTEDLKEFLDGHPFHLSTYQSNPFGIIDPEKYDGLLEVSRRFHDFAIWEFKSASVGSKTVMEGVLALASVPKFPWKKCSGRSFPNHKIYPSVHTLADATVTPWKIPDNSIQKTPFEISIACDTSGLRLRQYNAKQLPKEEPPSLTRVLVSTKLLKGNSKHKWQNEDEDGDGDEANNNNSKSNCYHSSGDHNGDNNHSNDTYNSSEEPTVEMYIQQAWAEAVKNDATIISLQAGSLEYICIRHRATQRLYISDAIRPDNCNNPRYGKLQVGLYIAAIEDAMNRALQLRKIEQENKVSGSAAQLSSSGHNIEPKYPGGGPSRSKCQKRSGGDSGKGSKSGQQSLKGNLKEGVTYQSRAELIHEMQCRKVALMYLQYWIYNSPIPASFKRILSSPFHRDGADFRDDECMTLILTSEIGGGSTGFIHGGTLEVQNSRGVTHVEDVVAKLAFSDTQKGCLQHEYTIYQHLASKHVQGLPTNFGIFDDMDGGPTMLLMTHAGTCLCPGKPISSSQRAGFISTLKKIHHAGILHNDLYLRNLLVNECGEVTIIDFDQAEEGPTENQMIHERARLTSLLDSLQ